MLAIQICLIASMLGLAGLYARMGNLFQCALMVLINSTFIVACANGL